MDDTDLMATIAQHRSDLVDMLTGLTAEDWDKPTLCEGWRVREVVAHITMQYRYSTAKFLVELARSRGRFNRMADRVARRDAAVLSAEELTESVKQNISTPWQPPGGGFVGALSHDVIHGLDIAVPLGVKLNVPAERLAIVLDGAKPKMVQFFGTDLAGIQLRADDIPWTHGTGTPLSGAAQDLLLVLCGRRIPADRLRGESSGRFTISP